MKCRDGFVSNSSSSSFVIAVPKDTELTLESMHEAMFGVYTERMFPLRYEQPNWVGRIRSYDVVKNILDQIAQGDPLDENNPRGKIETENLNSVVGLPPRVESSAFNKFYSGRGKDYKFDYEGYNGFCNHEKQQEANRLLIKFPAHDFYIVEFSDEYGAWNCEVEHGPCLNSLDCVTRYSHH